MSVFYRISFLVFLGAAYLYTSPSISCPSYIPSEDPRFHTGIHRLGFTPDMESEFEKGITYQAVDPTQDEIKTTAYGLYSITVILSPCASPAKYRCTTYGGPDDEITYVYSKINPPSIKELPLSHGPAYLSQTIVHPTETLSRFSFRRAITNLSKTLKRAKRATATALSCCFTAPSEKVEDSDNTLKPYLPGESSSQKEDPPSSAARPPTLRTRPQHVFEGRILDPTYVYIFCGTNESGDRTITHIPLAENGNRAAFTAVLPSLRTSQSYWV